MNFLKKHKTIILITLVSVLALTVVFVFTGNGERTVKTARTEFSAASEQITSSDTAKDSSQSGCSSVYTEKSAEESLPESIVSTDDDSVVSSDVKKTEKAISSTAESSLRYSSSVEVHSSSQTAEPPDESSVTAEESIRETSSVSSREDSVSVVSRDNSRADEDVFESAVNNCTISVSCQTLLDHLNTLSKKKAEFIPDDGIILKITAISFSDGESVFDVTKRACRENNIQFEFTITPIYNSAYIEGIGNIYEFDCGTYSGWLYKVNGEFKNVSCSDVDLKDGDRIEWVYTTDLGEDVGNKYEG